MSKEDAFLAVYPSLQNAVLQTRNLEELVADLVHSEFGPTLDDIPRLVDAMETLRTTLTSPVIEALQTILPLENMTRAVDLVAKSCQELIVGPLHHSLPCAHAGATDMENYINSLADRLFGKWGAYFFQLCADIPRPECLSAADCAPELLLEQRPEMKLSTASDKQLFIPTPLQEQILAALDGQAMKKQELADLLCKGEGTRLYRPGGIRELRTYGLVDNLRQIGFFRPDRPPEGCLWVEAICPQNAPN